MLVSMEDSIHRQRGDRLLWYSLQRPKQGRDMLPWVPELRPHDWLKKLLVMAKLDLLGAAYPIGILSFHKFFVSWGTKSEISVAM